METNTPQHISARWPMNRFHPGSFLRAWAIMAAFQLGSLIIGGFAIFFIVWGIYIAVRRPLIYWSRTRPWIAQFMGVPLRAQPVTRPSVFWRFTVSVLHFAVSLVYIALGLAVMLIGTKMLLADGFLHQNMIYMLFFHK